MRELVLCLLLLTCPSIIKEHLATVSAFFNGGNVEATGDVAMPVAVFDHLNLKKPFAQGYERRTAANFNAMLGVSKFRFFDIPVCSDSRSQPDTSDVEKINFIFQVAIQDTWRIVDTYNEEVLYYILQMIPLNRVYKDDILFLNGTNKSSQALVRMGSQRLSIYNHAKSPKVISSDNSFSPINFQGNSEKGKSTLKKTGQSTVNSPFITGSPLIRKMPDYWIRQSALTKNMPYGIEVYHSIADYSLGTGPIRKMNAYCIVVDPKYVDFKPTFNSPNKLPTAFVKDEPGTVLVCMNAGFFHSPSGSFSMLKYNGKTSANNIASLPRRFDGRNTLYFPTRAALGLAPNLAPDVAWVYNLFGVVYSFNRPSPNLLNVAPRPAPTTSDGVIWNIMSAVGGSPMLIKNGVINITDAEELIVIDNKSPRARSAIGYTEDGKIVMLVAEGGNAPVSDGLNLVELANYMKDLGCVGAINLDGGSSSTLRINNRQMIRPSSSGIEQPNAGVILIKAKN